MVSKMMAARIHPALSQSLGGVGVVVSVKFWFGRRRLFSPGCGCGSGCGSGFGSGGFLFVVLSYVLTLSCVAHAAAATPLVTVNAARNPSEQWRTFSGNDGYEVAGQGSNIKNPTDVVNVCAGQQFYIGGGLIPESGGTQSTIFRVLYWRDEQVKYALAAMRKERGRDLHLPKLLWRDSLRGTENRRRAYWRRGAPFDGGESRRGHLISAVWQSISLEAGKSRRQ